MLNKALVCYMIKKSPVLIAKSLAEAVEGVDLNREISVSCIPLLNDEAVRKFTCHIRQSVGSLATSGVGSFNVESTLKNIFGETPHIFDVRETPDFREIFEIKLANNIGLKTSDGKTVDLTLPHNNGHIIASAITQKDGKKEIQPKRHRDKNILTINFYAAGNGIRYMLQTKSGPLIQAFKSPCITVHRGEAHPFGPEHAVPHAGQANEGVDAANILFVMRERSSTLQRFQHC
jgi:hypothetical protein